jgi:hypothetical protein
VRWDGEGLLFGLPRFVQRLSRDPAFVAEQNAHEALARVRAPTILIAGGALDQVVERTVVRLARWLR